MSRPELPKLARGDRVIIRSDGRRAVSAYSAVITSIGPKWLTAGGIRFLLTDQIAGAPGARVGYGTTFATPEQHAYDRETQRAQEYIRKVAGLDVRPGSPFRDRDMLVNLANVLRELLPDDQP